MKGEIHNNEIHLKIGSYTLNTLKNIYIRIYEQASCLSEGWSLQFKSIATQKFNVEIPK